MRSILTLTALLAASQTIWATAALAQTYPQPGLAYPTYPGGVPAAIADQHRYENDRLRYQAQSNADQARQQQVETQLRLRAIEAAREPMTVQALPPRPLYSPEQEQALRQSATERRRQTAQGMSQIDDWLARPQ
jgi:hypothetical protein